MCICKVHNFENKIHIYIFYVTRKLYGVNCPEQACDQEYILKQVHTCIHTYITNMISVHIQTSCTYIHTYMHTYIHTCIHAYTRPNKYTNIQRYIPIYL